jgi:hypothetical protein
MVRWNKTKSKMKEFYSRFKMIFKKKKKRKKKEEERKERDEPWTNGPCIRIDR